MNHLSEREKLILAYMEGDLGEAECREMESLLKEDTALREELQAFEQTRVQPDATISFRNKTSLLQPVPAKRIVFNPYIISAVAASLILLLGWYFLFQKEVPKERPVVKQEERGKGKEKEKVKEKEVALVPEQEKRIATVEKEKMQETRTKTVVVGQKEKEKEKEEVREVELGQMDGIILPNKTAKKYSIEIPNHEVLPMDISISEKPTQENKRGFSVAQAKYRVEQGLARIATFLKKPEIEIEKDEDGKNNYTINIYHAAWIK